MAIYIKGMEMPKGKAVDLTISPNGGVIVWTKIHYYGPIQQLRATEVPEPHGRLIDADACIDYIRNSNQRAWETLAYAPTVIERSDK